MQKFNITFQKILLILGIVMFCGCIFGWVNIAKFANEFEDSLLIAENNAIKQEEKSEILAEELLNEQEVEEFGDLAIEIAQKYAKFTSADLKFNDIKDYFKENSEILELLETYNSNRYNDHEKSYFENISLKDPVLISENSVKCEVSFDYIVITKENTHTFASTYILYFDTNDKKVTSITMG